MSKTVIKKRGASILMMFALLLFGSVFQSCEKEKAEAKSMENLRDEQGVPVKTIKVVPGEFVKSLNFFAKLSGKVESVQTGKISDVVQKVNARVGDNVKKGQIIVEMPTNNPNLRYQQALIGFETIKKTYNRMKNLLEAGETSQQQFDEIETQYRVNQENIKSIEQTLFIEAPISGTIIAMNIHQGDMLQLNMGQPTPIFTVAQLETMKSTIYVSESEVRELKNGMPLSCEFAGETFKGRVTNVYPAMDVRKNAFPVEIEISNPKKILKSGTTVEVIIDTYSNEEVISLPVNIVKTEDDKSYIFVENGDKAEKRYVSTGVRNGINVEIYSGVRPGDKVIKEGISLLEDGKKIKNVD